MTMRDFETSLTQDRLKAILHYNPDTGIWTWLVDQKNGAIKVGTVAGSFTDKGYHTIKIDGFLYKSHRLAFLYMLGRWPSDQVDHDDTYKSHNCWDNLREATNQLNGMNREANRNNKLGIKGIRVTRTGKFQTRIRINNVLKDLGTHPTLQDAVEARRIAETEFFGCFGRK
ncbi:MAG: HNH endonuclease [Mesorhizobium sp.]|nr:MAG: HNH endonuclease [Mesorhizobium sp.]